MKKGYFGEFGGCFVPELLMPPLAELDRAMRDIMPAKGFKADSYIAKIVGKGVGTATFTVKMKAGATASVKVIVKKK